MSPELRRYLDLERAMIALDEVEDSGADTLRDAMDPLWYDLSDAEQAWINSRDDVPLHKPRSTNLVVGQSLFVEPVLARFSKIPRGPLTGWDKAA